MKSKQSRVDYFRMLYRPPLAPFRREGRFSLDKNESAFSAFELCEFSLSDDNLKSLKQYPDPYKLYGQLAEFLDVEREQLLITAGSEQAIEFVFRLVLDKGDEVLFPSPSFAMYDVFGLINQANIKKLDYDRSRQLSVEMIIFHITPKTKLFVLANPDNTTGSCLSVDEIEKIADHCEKNATYFLLDEAYFHYTDHDTLSLVNIYTSLIITRTFSKAWGLAGIRVGYAISNRENIKLLRTFKPIDEINQLSLLATMKALENAELILGKNVAQVIKWKALFKELESENVKVPVTHTNFIILEFKDSESYERMKNVIAKSDILVKYDFEHVSMVSCIRFSVGSDAVMQRLKELIAQSL